MAEPSVVDVSNGDMRLRDLISAVVRSEVDAFRERQVENQLLRVLSKEQIAAGAEVGKITSGGSDIDQTVDTAAATATALEAFADGFYFVFVDDKQVDDLDQTITVSDDTSLLFVRLVPLAGG